MSHSRMSMRDLDCGSTKKVRYEYGDYGFEPSRPFSMVSLKGSLQPKDTIVSKSSRLINLCNVP